ncbi:hypothetical protein GA0061099_101520 [Bradyrhizobium yuanmingense]|uniref:Uncharacterized protein n=1 Tax=Bradyrhizobium yuanmingense TaxID=108015 RepID=A0A1C3XFR8_9BRAD|nr:MULTISPECIES: hypothetical protein [Bradyrhizobium]TWI19210.1 hypothetical protein IQ15_06943 [Bradyrhizobium yuanmingense]SCB51111.1 hypothetical protein GA0061099_101520 [Bradyrhizobium yuanmingense]
MGSGGPAAGWEAGVGAGRDSVPDEGAGVGVAFDAMAFNQRDLIP